MSDQLTEISIEGLKNGDREQFVKMVDAYSPSIYRLALRMLEVEQDAEDVLQITFIKALQHIQEFEGRSSITTWLYRIAANEALMFLRKKKPTVSLDIEPQDADGEVLQPRELADWSKLPETGLLDEESKRLLNDAVNELPEKLKVVFLLRDIEGLSIKETGETLNLTETTVKTRLLRARLNLREKLSVYFAERIREEKAYGTQS